MFALVRFVFLFLLLVVAGCVLLYPRAHEEEEFLQIGVVGFDREVRRYLFHSYFTEIESNGSQILVRSECGDESVGEEIVSAEVI